MPHFNIDPKKELEFLSGRMKKFIEEFPDSFSVEIGNKFEPKVDIASTAGTVTVFAELPGVAKEDISVVLKEHTLQLAGRKQIVAKDEDGITMHKQERSQGEFLRSIPLPFQVAAEQMTATLADGVLTVTLQRQARPQEQEISITIQ